jgi:hypothetical protein
MSRAFPRKGMRGGPGGSGRLVDFVFDVQTESKAARDTAPMAITTVVSMKVNTKKDGFTAHFDMLVIRVDFLLRKSTGSRHVSQVYQ